ncbi:hypothetical protein KVR01_013145 [Diaporthe batatas]|uniref:uncharacterized protein n=1 Tax=Diaporthe batatas TaxID=748121 RepID=UPI001D050553|nr:uncharacterized protein KVR01_013145 [Diaporthe batatas]KAG8156923.1 hypothetical protein KVR01_013145 [Diaporthe batatas]
MSPNQSSSHQGRRSALDSAGQSDDNQQQTNDTLATRSSVTYTITPELLSSPYALSPEAYLAANPSITDIIGSAAVFYHPQPHSQHQPRLLLIQRSPHDFFPLKWELPGGSVDRGADGDSSLAAGAVRELREETGLEAVRVVRWVANREFPEGDGVRTWRQVIFEVEIGEVGEEEEGMGGPRVTLDPEEHVDYRWVTAEEVRQRRCGEVVLEDAGPEWRAVLKGAFEMHSRKEESR